MPIRIDVPVIYLAFANEQRGQNMFLRNLKIERELIRSIFEDAQNDGELELVIDPDVTQQQIFRTFQGARYRDRVCIFHYGGHADSDELLLEAELGGNEAFYSAGMAALFGQQKALKLAFLNGCATRAQADLLLNSGVSVVIATSRKIKDEDATLFSQAFYRGIAGNATIERAFKEAESALLSRHGSLDTFRSVYWEKEESANDEELPWKLFYKEEKSILWTLHPEEAMGTGMSLVDVKTALIGREIGNYVISEYLNVGNFGFVFRAKHKTLNEEVAIKISHRIMAGYDRLREVVITGSTGLRALNHPNIARTEDMGEFAVDKYDKRFYVIMELVDGVRLDKSDLGIQGADSHQMQAIMSQVTQILEGMRYAHELVYEDNRGFRILGALHGNIKTRKVIFNAKGIPKLIDFMIADLTRQSDVQIEYPPELEAILISEKKDDYSAPEQVEKGTINVLTDIFSLGAVLCELFTGKKINEQDISSVQAIEQAVSSYGKNTPTCIAGIIFKATRPFPQHRHQSVAEMIQEMTPLRLNWWQRILLKLGLRKA